MLTKTERRIMQL